MKPFTVDEWHGLKKFWEAMVDEYVTKDFDKDDHLTFWGTAHLNASHCRDREMSLKLGLRRHYGE